MLIRKIRHHLLVKREELQKECDKAELENLLHVLENAENFVLVSFIAKSLRDSTTFALLYCNKTPDAKKLYDKSNS